MGLQLVAVIVGQRCGWQHSRSGLTIIHTREVEVLRISVVFIIRDSLKQIDGVVLVTVETIHKPKHITVDYHRIGSFDWSNIKWNGVVVEIAHWHLHNVGIRTFSSSKASIRHIVRRTAVERKTKLRGFANHTISEHPHTLHDVRLGWLLIFCHKAKWRIISGIGRILS